MKENELDVDKPEIYEASENFFVALKGSSHLSKIFEKSACIIQDLQ